MSKFTYAFSETLCAGEAIGASIYISYTIIWYIFTLHHLCGAHKNKLPNKNAIRYNNVFQ